MSPLEAWARRVSRYLVLTLLIAAAVAGMGWLALDAAGRRGALLAAGVVAATQTVAFGGLACARPGSNRFFGFWVAGTLLRLGALGGIGLALESYDGVDPLVTLLTMAGMFFVLMLLELRMYRGEGSALEVRHTNQPGRKSG